MKKVTKVAVFLLATALILAACASPTTSPEGEEVDSGERALNLTFWPR